MKTPSVSPSVFGGCAWDAKGFSLEVLGARVEDPLTNDGEEDFGVRDNGASVVWPKTEILPLPKENLLAESLTCEFPAEAKLKGAEVEVKENPLLLFWFAAVGGAILLSNLEDMPKAKLDCELDAPSVKIFWDTWGGIRLA